MREQAIREPTEQQMVEPVGRPILEMKARIQRLD